MLGLPINWPWRHNTPQNPNTTLSTRQLVLGDRYGQFYQPSREEPMKTYRIGQQMPISVMSFFPSYTVSLWEDLGNPRECGAVLRQNVDHRPGPFEYNWTVETYWRPLPRPAAHNYYYLLVSNGSDYDPNEMAAPTNVTGPKFTSAMFNIVAANYTEPGANGTVTEVGNGTTPTVGAGTLNATAPGIVDDKGAEGKGNALPIALGVVFGVLGLALLGFIYWWCVRGRRRGGDQQNEPMSVPEYDRSQLDGRELSPTEAKTFRDSSTAHMSPVTQHSASPLTSEFSEFGNHAVVVGGQGPAELGP
ncbi:hypothetical protein QBC39DRAFT_134438 [Podospora conica]|nr:hypothetical protein QBC39DRAFT_134438 [Schizothecium conicum]